ncbi:MAG: hypothetical protein ACREH8_23105 [Opitutaceae bacterium]
MRQPGGRKTGRKVLDESYVFCFQRKGRELLQDVRKGFDLEGLGDLQGHVAAGNEPTDLGPSVTVPRRSGREGAERIVLPAFMIRDGAEWRLVHYEADILSRVPWDNVAVEGMRKIALSTVAGEGSGRRYAVGLDEGVFDDSDEARGVVLATPLSGSRLYAFAASHLLDVAGNEIESTAISFSQ